MVKCIDSYPFIYTGREEGLPKCPWCIITENMVNIAINRDRVLEEDIDSDDEVSLEGNVLATV